MRLLTHLKSLLSSCKVRFLLIENVFNLNPFQRQKSLALNFEGRVQISQELKALKIAPKSLFKKGETGIVFWISVVINLRVDAPSHHITWTSLLTQ